VPEAEFIYIGKGRFRINDDANCLLATRDGRKYLMMEMSKTAQTMVMAESISPAKADTSAFAGKTWVPTNFKTGDLGAGALSLCRSGEIKELPGVIYLAASPATTIAYGLSDKYTGKMILPHIRDLSGFRVDIKTGVLSIDAYRYVDAQKVPSLSKGEKITIGKDGYNAARKITSDTVFSYSIPPQGRIMVFSPDGMVAYDSLVEEKSAHVLEPGSFALFIGGPDTVFVAK
jgi:hypothetical protein